MDVFLLHCLLLLWTSIGAARQLTTRTADRFLASALLAWGNLVVTSLLLSTVHRLGEPSWFLATSNLLSAVTCLWAMRLRPASIPADFPARSAASGMNPWLLAGFILAIAPLAFASIGIAYAYPPNSDAALTHDLPRAMYYLGQNSLANFDASDLRQVHLPFNYNLLQLFVLEYGPPLPCLNLFNLIAWAVGGIALFRLCRLCTFGPNASLVACWLALTSTQVIVQATSANNSLPAGAALLCSLVFGLRWRQTRAMPEALLAGLAFGLAAGSRLSILGFLPVAAVFCWSRIRQLARLETAVPKTKTARVWILPALLAFTIAAPFALMNLAGMRRGLMNPGHGFFERFPIFVGTMDAVRTFLTELWPRLFSPGLEGDGLGFGFAGLLFWGCAAYCLVRERKITGPARWFAGLGLSWLACYFIFSTQTSRPADFVPVLLLMAPCVAATVTAAFTRSSNWRYAGGLVVFAIAAASEWSAGTYLLRNSPRPLAPLLSASFIPRTLPALPLLVGFRLRDEPRINIDTDAVNERIFPFMTLGHNQRFTSSGSIDPDSYNLISRAAQSRNSAYLNLGSMPSYSLVAIPAKRTAGVEFLATIGAGTTARDYYGIERHAAQAEPIDSNRSLLVTLTREPGATAGEAPTLIKVAGLNHDDNVRLAVILERDAGTTVELATFSSDSQSTLSIQGPFHALVFKAIDLSTGGEIGSSEIPYLAQKATTARAVDSSQPSNARSLFVTDVVQADGPEVIPSEGLLPTEGPFPQWNMPYPIRWAKQVAVSLKIPSSRELASLQVSFSVRTYVRPRADLQVIFNGRIIQTYHLEEKLQWLDQTLELIPTAGTNVLEFRDATYKTKPDWLDYLQRYPDVKNYLVSQKAPLEQGAKEHYESKGKAEGRTVSMRPTGELEPAYKSYYFMYRNIRLEGFKLR